MSESRVLYGQKGGKACVKLPVGRNSTVEGSLGDLVVVHPPEDKGEGAESSGSMGGKAQVVSETTQEAATSW